MKQDEDRVKYKLVYPLMMLLVIISLIGVIFVFEIKQTIAMNELSAELIRNTKLGRDLFEQGRKRDLKLNQIEEEILGRK